MQYSWGFAIFRDVKNLFCRGVVFLAVFILARDTAAGQGKSYTPADTGRAITFFEKAKKLYNRGEYIEALGILENAKDIKEKFQGEYEPDVIRVYNNIGNIYLDLRVADSAWFYFEKAEALLLKKYGKEHPWLPTIYMNEGLVYELKDDYESALAFHAKALKTAETNKGTLSEIIAFLYYNMGASYYKKKEYTKAMEYFNKILNIHKTHDVPMIGKTYNMAGLTYACLGDYAKADKYHCLDVAYREKKYGHMNYETAKAYLNYGIFCIDYTDCKKGLPLCQKAYHIFLQTVGVKNLFTSFSLMDIGDYWIKVNKPDSALYYYQKALISLSAGFSNINNGSNPEVSGCLSLINLIDILKKKASAFLLLAQQDTLQQGHFLQPALAAYQKAIEAIESLRSGYLFEESKLFLAENEKSTYLGIISTALKLYRATGNLQYADTAFVYAEKSKAAVLLSSLREVKARQFGNIPGPLQEKEQTVSREISVHEQFVYNEKQNEAYDTAKVARWESRLFDLYREKEGLLHLFEKEYPAYHKLKYNTRVTNVQAVQKKLEKNGALLEYVLADSLLYTFVITKDTLVVLQQETGPCFFRNTEIVGGCLSQPAYGNYTGADMKRYVSAAYALYKILIKPTEEWIKEKKLLIVPDGELAFIPMGALPNSPVIPENINFAALPYLVHEYTFCYLYSATLLLDENRQPTGSPVKMGAFAPCYASTEYTELGTEEAVAALKIYPGDLFASDGATEKKFKNCASKYSILHLSMHGLVNMDDPMYSKLVFGQGKDTSEDGFLYAYEIYNMRVNALLTVLSACNTGAGRLQKGEGVMSLARAFTYAGCPSVITTLWAVVNSPGVELMSGFYKYLSRGKCKGEALGFSQLDYLASATPARGHPHYWAGYVALGDPVAMPSKNNWLYYIIGCLILLAIGAGVVWRKKLKTTFFLFFFYQVFTLMLNAII